MDNTTLKRATEPFFTTKPPGEGTGLGLSMAKGFAEQSGGALIVNSAIGQGTTVNILLPEAEGIDPVCRRSESKAESDSLHILLVDDDALVLSALSAGLEQRGYAVSRARDASEAEMIFASKGADLLMTDFSMPGIDGVALIENLQAMKKNLPAILVTGHAAQCPIRYDTASFLTVNKPVSWSKLQEAISTSLRKPKLT
jgi:CheY-like chemotaxis protein